MSKHNFDPEQQEENLAEDDIVTNEQDEACSENNESDNMSDWEQKFNALNDTYLRLNAEFDNYRKRTTKEKADLLKVGGERVLLDVISITDDFGRALDNMYQTDDIEAVREGVVLINSKFVNFLNKHNVKEMKTIGEVFDVDKHEAITTIPATTEEDKNKIVDCIQKGYTLDDKIIRFPKVIVAK